MAKAKDVQQTKSSLPSVKSMVLYVLIGGLIISAIISVVAILVGEFNDVVVKALLTTFVFVTHSLLILALVAADKDSRIGKSIMPTAITTVVVANLITWILGIWSLWKAEYSLRALGLYITFLGICFLLAGIQKMRIAHQPTRYATLVASSFSIALGVVLLPWILGMADTGEVSFYFRLVSAVGILTVTSLAIMLILNRIAVAHKPELKQTVGSVPESKGMLAIIITVGVIVAYVWLGGTFAFVVRAVDSSQPQNSDQYYNY